MSDGYSSSYGAILYDKQNAVRKHLKGSPPTVVVRTSKGIYVFSENVAKVYSNILLIGAGRQCPSVANWFRGQLSDLSMVSSPRDPDAQTDTRLLLPPLFYPNTDFSRDLIFADVVVVEIAKKQNEDYVARVDSLGNIEEYGDPVFILRYDDDVKHNHVVSREEERKLFDGALKKFGVRLPEGFKEQEDVESFILELRAKYPGDKRFLNRDKFRDKQYQWIVENI